MQRLRETRRDKGIRIELSRCSSSLFISCFPEATANTIGASFVIVATAVAAIATASHSCYCRAFEDMEGKMTAPRLDFIDAWNCAHSMLQAEKVLFFWVGHTNRTYIIKGV